MAYLDVLGHRTWVVDEGEGGAVVLLHGAFHGSDAMLAVFGSLRSARRVVAFDRCGHGRTADGPGEFHYQAMADEVLAVLDTLDLASADIVGYSDGGITALCLALRRPEVLRSLVLIGTNIASSPHPEPDPRIVAAMRKAYAALSPDGPDHFDEVTRKSFAMFAHEPDFDLAAIESVVVPTLVLVGDHDSVPLDNTVTLFRTLPRAQLAVVPGASHHVIWERPEEVAGIVGRFLLGSLHA